MKKTISFGPYLPDQPDLFNPGLIVAKNVIPSEGSYRPLSDLSVYSDALTGTCLGAKSIRNSSGTIFNFAGDETKLYQMNTAVWSDVTRISGGSYAAPFRWQFVPFGNNVVAFNGADTPQKFLMGTDTNFSDLTVSPPVFSHAATVKEFLVVGNITGAQNRFQWCDQNDITNWSTGQSGSKDLTDGGDIMAIVGGDYAVIMQENQISRLDYIGKPTIWIRRVLEEDQGTIASSSVVSYKNYIYYLAQDGFYLFDGLRSHAIGDGRIDKTVMSELDQNNLERVYGVIDPINKVVIWAYPGAGSIEGQPNKLAIYNYGPEKTKRWATGELTLEFLYSARAEGYTLESLSAVYPDLETVPASLDSRAWKGGALLLAAFDSANKLNYFTGDSLEAILETGEVQLTDGLSLVTNTRPLVDAAATVRLGYRLKTNEAVTYTASSPQNIQGQNPLIANGRYHSAEVTIPAGAAWTHAQGIELIYEPNGD